MFHQYCPQVQRPQPTSPILDRNPRPNAEIAPNCPRCASANTKFCYYNNYSLSQPRYFCKGCRRYWTKGGSLRNVPVGGGCRKSRRSKSSSLSSSKNMISTYSDQNSRSRSNEENFNNGSSPDIDLADVFAKFLNPNTISESDHFVVNNDQETFPNEIVDHFSNSSSSINETVDLVQEFQFPNETINLSSEHQDLLLESDHDLSSFGLHDVLWDESDSSNAKFDWQIPCIDDDIGDEDQLMKTNCTIPNFLSGNNWSSFDLSGF
ncbi:hypothetical protein ACFE04_012880 [Oxalis oulophora]